MSTHYSREILGVRLSMSDLKRMPAVEHDALVVIAGETNRTKAAMYKADSAK